MANINLDAIKKLNEVARQKNEERLRLKGAVDSAKNNYDEAVSAYASKYGVSLDGTNIQDEYYKVSSDLADAYAKLQSDIEYIESGIYKEKATEEVVTPVDEVVEKPKATRGRPPKSATVEAPVVETPVAEAPVVAPVVEQNVVPPVVNSGVSIPDMAAPVQSTTPVTNIPLDALDMASKQVVPKAPVDDVEDDTTDEVVVPVSAPVSNVSFGIPTQAPVSAPAPAVDETPVEEQPFTPDGWGGNKPDLDASLGSFLGSAGTIKFGE